MTSLRSLFGDDGVILRQRNFQLLLLANMVGPLGISLLSPVLDSLIEPFGTTPANIGLVTSFFTAPSIVMIPIAGVLSDRFGRKTVLVACLTVFGFSGTAIAFTTDFSIVLGLRAIQGIAFGGLTPVIITSVGDLYTGTRETTAQGLRFTGTGISLTIFPLVAGLMVGVAWQYPFFIHVMALPIAGAVLLWFEEPIDGTVRNDGGRSESYRRALGRLLRERRILAMVIARGLGTVVWTGFLTYNSLIVVRVIGGTAGQAGIIVSLGSAFFAVTASQAGRLTSLFDNQVSLLVAANCALGGGMAFMVLSTGIFAAGVAIIMLGSGFGIALSLYRSIITGLAPQSLRGGLVSISESAGRIMDTLTPIAMGGIIGVFTPTLGFVPAVQLAGLGAALVGAGGGILCLYMLHATPGSHIEQ